MIIVYPSFHIRHRPPNEVFNGNRDAHAEVPERIEAIRHGLEQVPGMRFTSPKRFPLTWIERVHDHAYIDYFADAGRLSGSSYVYPSVFPYCENAQTDHPIGQRGKYSFDTYTPVSRTTYEAARGSAMTALTAASLVRRGAPYAYALCRPPGHHAEYARMGGYCYFNNAAIAANYLSDRGRVVVLDIDVHHGNGTQALFYTRRDVLTVSIHGNPDGLFPYFTGRESEQGSGVGEGYNVNIPLAQQTGDRAYSIALARACNRITAFAPTYLVVSVGYDAHVSDPIGGFTLSTSMYHRIARSIAKLQIPTVLIQEGGYNVQTLGEISQSFVDGIVSSD